MGAKGEFRLDVPDPEQLAELASEPLPFGLRSGTVQRIFQRDIYFDTHDRALNHRGVICRFRARSDDQRLLTISVREKAEGGRIVSRQDFESLVSEVDPRKTLMGESEAARRLRAIIDPDRLRPLVELETERRIRRARHRWLPLTQFELMYDQVTVQKGGLERAFQEIKVRRVHRGGPSLEQFAHYFLDQHQLRSLVMDKLDRSASLLRALESEALARGVRGAWQVVVIAVDEGCIALRCEGGALSLPVGEGTGEAAGRHVLRSVFGSAEGRLQLVGTVPATETRPALEVWLARRPRRTVAGGGDGAMEWLPLDVVLSRVGSPAVRDPQTLAALTVAARSDLVTEWPSGETATPLRERAPRPSDGSMERTLSELERPTLPEPALDPGRPAPEQFINAELSALEFNARVLGLAEDPRTPLLERIRFLSIVSTNLDEFFMVRVGGLKRAAAEGDTTQSTDGLTPQEQLDAIAIRARQLIAQLYRCFGEMCVPELAAQGMRIRRWADLDKDDRTYLQQHFDEQIFPVLTPRAITMSPGHPFPYIANLALSIAVMVRDPHTGPTHFAHLRVPQGLPRFVPLRGKHHFVRLDDIICANLAPLYPEREVDQAHAFRVTRSGDVQLDESGAGNLLQAIEEEVQRRPFQGVVRVEVERSMPQVVRGLLLRELRFEKGSEAGALGDADLYDVDGFVDLSALSELADLDIPELHYPPYSGRSPIEKDRAIFEVLAERDVLVHHPYDRFDESVQRLFVEAADDPTVVAIKLTLYRSGARSEIVDALVRAAQAGKDVSVFVELKARFDEQRNIAWAKKLEEAGIHVIYGLVRLKTHSKIALVVRREDEKIRRYVHIGTGNYNAATAQFYTDLGLLSSDPELGSDLSVLFNELTGASRAPQTEAKRLLVAPTHMLRTFLALIEREAEHARAGRGGKVIAKLNGLADTEIISALYRASQAGGDIDLIVRGICALRPGVPGLSDRIRVISILGRFLEHARIFYFANAGDPNYFIGSADWRPRNVRRRVEVATPVLDKEACARLDSILQTELNDPTAWELHPDGSYARRTADGTDADLKGAQEQFMNGGTS